MKRTLRARSAAAALVIVAAPVQAAQGTTTVNVALLDISSVMGGEMTGMMGQGKIGSGMGMMGMDMMSIRVDQATVKTGTIHSAVTKWSRAILHEMLVVAIENPNAPLPCNYATAKVPEDQIKSLGEVGELKANESGAMDVKLPPVTYMLICNLAGHYAAGMVTPLTVTQ